MASFIRHKKEDDKTSPWHHFLTSSDKEAAKCKKCGAVLKTKGGSTKGLHEHLKIHGIKVCRPVTAPCDVPCKMPKITTHFEAKDKDDLRVVLSRLVALDGLAFATIAKSIEIKKSLECRKFKVPKSASTIKTYVMQYYNEVRSSVKKEICEIKSHNNKFSISLDEWTSIANKRFLNIILQGNNQFWNLGLAKIVGSATTENLAEMLEKRLSDFGLELSNDIVGITTDGASTMTKLGRIIAPDQQLCLAHGIQLGIIDVLYKSSINLHQNNDFVLSNSDNSDSDQEDEERVDTIQLLNDERPSEVTEYCGFKEIIAKVRKIVRSFRKSAKNDEILQQYVKLEFKKELKLILDCQTRWNSLLKMIERFVLLESCLKKAVVDLKTECLEDCQFTILRSVIKILKPAELAIEALCNRETNLCSADAAINFMFNEIENVHMALARKMYTTLKFRVTERTTINTAILKILTTGENTKPPHNLDKISEKIIKLLQRFKSEEKENGNIEEVCEKDCEIIDNEKTLQQKLKDQLEASRTSKTSKTLLLEEAVPKEISLLLGGGGRGANLEIAFQYLNTISATSVECERSFSASGRISTKIRSSLDAKTLDALIFLKYNLK